MKGTKGHRERKNGASREQWKERKAAANAARPEQKMFGESSGDTKLVNITRVRE
jgi:hypothetical protein